MTCFVNEVARDVDSDGDDQEQADDDTNNDNCSSSDGALYRFFLRARNVLGVGGVTLAYTSSVDRSQRFTISWLI